MIAAFIFVRGWRSISLIVSSFALLATIYLIAASNHVRVYEFSPRYFAVPLFLGSLIPLLLLASRFAELILRSSDVRRMLGKFSGTLQYLRISILVLCFISFVFVGNTKIDYGSGIPDAIGFNNTGRIIELTDFVEFQNRSNSQPLFISGNYWDVWPTVFELRSRGVNILAITKKAEFQSDFKSLYTGQEIAGICVDTVEKCYGSTINAQLYGRQLLSSIDEVPLMILSNGIELRLMKVSKP
jgi:hypothetical protein